MAGRRVERRLAAVLAADVAGYSRLMGADELGTLEALKAYRRDFVDPAIAEHNGRIVKTTGDGVLVEFASAVDAVTCAVTVQQKIAEYCPGGAEPRILFRVGVNVGDIIVDADDIFGDGVNVAARVQNECEPGGVCLSGSAFDQIVGKLKLEFHDLGEKALKNIERPVRLYAIGFPSAAPAPEVGSGPHRPPSQGQPGASLPLPEKPSIAVLPFENMSGDPEQEYFADGLVEDIITALSRFSSLFVIARNSSFTYKGKSPDVRQVGRELGVRYVLEGSVRKSANRVRITGQLVDSVSGTHLWADRFDGGLDDIFELQDRVTERVVSSIAPRVEQAEIERSQGKSTDRLDAYDYYLRGIARLNLVAGVEPEAVLAAAREARTLFLKAIELDPGFARAYAAAAQSYLIESQNVGATPDRRGLVAEAVRVSRRAASLGQEDATALSRAGQTLAYVAGEIDEGAILIERALALNPNLALAWNFGGWSKIFLGAPEEAVDRFAHAMRLNPLDPFLFLLQLGTACGHLFSGHDEEAAMWAEDALHQRPRAIICLRVAVACLALAGRLEEAKDAAMRLRELSPQFRISQVKTLFPLRRPSDLARYCQGLRLAGLPE